MDAETAVPAPEDRTLGPLPVTNTATGAWRAVLDGRDVLLVVVALAFVPAGLLIFAEVGLGRFSGLPAVLDRVVSLLFDALGYATAAYVASYWHRFLLLGSDEVLVTLPRWTPGESRLFWRYVGFAILAWIGSFIVVLAVAPFVIFFEGSAALPPWGTALFIGGIILLPSMYVTARISLAFPAAAIDGPSCSFRKSWKATAGNGWRVACTPPWPSRLSRRRPG